MAWFKVLKYVRGYWGFARLNIFFNILYSLFSVFSITLIKPFLDLLFQNEKLIQEYYTKNIGSFRLSAGYAEDFLYKKMTMFITQDGLDTEQVRMGKIKALAFICILVFILTLLKNLCRYLAMYFLAPVRVGVSRDLRNRMFAKSLDLHLAFHSSERKGDIMSRITSDVEEIEWSIMLTLELIFREPIIITTSFILLLSISYQLTFYVLFLLPVAAVIVITIGKILKRYARLSKESYATIISIIEEALGGLKVIKAFTGEGFIKRKFADLNQLHFKQKTKMQRLTDLTSPISETVVIGILMIILFIGGNMVLGAETLKGSDIIVYFGVASQIVPPIKQITVGYNYIQKGIASEERIEKILLAEIDIKDSSNAREINKFEQGIRYKNVSFAYTKGDRGYVLRNINLEIEKGKTIALVGHSGSGKTTLADMLPRFYEVSEGDILIDGVPIKDIKIGSLRTLMGIVSQESVLFNDSVYNNIAFGMEQVNEQQVMEAAKIANAHDFIMAMPDGYNTNIGDRGNKLSGGQRQRISIARAVLKNPPILILDEATSALDTESERLVQEALTKLMQNRTSVVIAHRLSTIVHANEIIVLSKGEIIERGTHEELLRKNGTYKGLYDMQSFT